MRKYKYVKIILLLFLSLAGAKCEEAFECINGIKPVMISKELKAGNQNKMYNDMVTFEMQNATSSLYFISSFSVEGRLPPGISYSLVNHNSIYFNGIPSTSGTYEFTVSINVLPYIYNDSEDLCRSASSKKYKIIINNLEQYKK